MALRVTLHGSGENMRNFLFVTDVARAFDFITHLGEVGHIYNIGGQNERKNIEVAREIISTMELPGDDEFISFVEDRPFNDLRYHINSDKLIELGWGELVTWEEGLRLTVNWYQEHSDRFGDIEQALVAHPRAGLSK